MSIFQKLGVAFGVGSVKVAVAVVEPTNFRGSPVHGSVLLEGGEVDIHLLMLTVDLREFWVVQSGKSRSRTIHVRNRVMLAQEMTVPTDFRQEYPFEISLPADARCSRRQEGWDLAAEAHIPMAIDARANAVLKVVPQPEILAIQRATRDLLGFIPVNWEGVRPEIYYNFRAPLPLQDCLDGIALKLYVNADAVVGEIVLNRQEHGVGGFLSAMVGGDREVVPLAIPRAALLTRRGAPNPAGADAHLRAALNSAGVVV